MAFWILIPLFILLVIAAAIGVATAKKARRRRLASAGGPATSPEVDVPRRDGAPLQEQRQH